MLEISPTEAVSQSICEQCYKQIGEKNWGITNFSSGLQPLN